MHIQYILFLCLCAKIVCCLYSCKQVTPDGEYWCLTAITGFSTMVVQCVGCKRQFATGSGFSSHIKSKLQCREALETYFNPHSGSDSDVSEPGSSGGCDGCSGGMGNDKSESDGDEPVAVGGLENNGGQWNDPRYWDADDIQGQQLWSQTVISKVITLS